jgi:DNA polymerase III epsilon subunit-like protein
MYCFIAWDLEATNKNPKTEEITQIGLSSCLVDVNGQTQHISDFLELVKCKKKIDPISSQITGITDAMLVDAAPLPEVLTRVTEFFNQLPPDKERVLYAHNGEKFDLILLVYDMRRNGLDPLAIIRPWKVNWCVDSLPLARNTLDTTKLTLNERGLPCYKLESIYSCFINEHLEHAHNALYDSKAVLRMICEIPSMRDALFSDLESADPHYCKNILTFIQEIKQPTTKRKQVAFSSPTMYKKQKTDHECIVTKAVLDSIVNNEKKWMLRSGTENQFQKMQWIHFRFGKESIDKQLETICFYSSLKDVPIEFQSDSQPESNLWLLTF